MSTQQNDALQCAADLEYSIARHGMQDAFTLNAYRAMKMVRTQLARITELESQLEAIGTGGVSGPPIGQPQAMPDLSQLTERGSKAWAGVDAQGRPEGFTAADMATAAAQGFRDGVASFSANAGEPVVPPNAITASVMRDDGGEAPAFCLMAAYRSEKDAMDAFALIAAAPARPAAQPGVAYAALPEKYYLAGGEVPTWDEKQMHAFADATHTLRASHGQAPAQAASSAVLKAIREANMQLVRTGDDAFMLVPYKAVTAQAADSVTAPAPPPECETEAEKRAFAFGWFKALESERMKAESVQEDAARKQGEKQ